MSSRPQSATHPWRKAGYVAVVRTAAKKKAKALYDKERHTDEFVKLRSREHSRKRHGLPLEPPLAKPWDFAKGKVKT